MKEWLEKKKEIDKTDNVKSKEANVISSENREISQKVERKTKRTRRKRKIKETIFQPKKYLFKNSCHDHVIKKQ